MSSAPAGSPAPLCSADEPRSLLARAAPLVAARAVSAVVTVAIPLALARFLPVDQYGTYKQLLLIAQTLYFVLPMGMPQSLYFFIPRASAARHWLVQTLLFTLAVGLIGGVLLVCMRGAVVSLLHNPALGHYLVGLAIYTGGLIAGSPLEMGLTAQGRNGRSALCYLASDFLRMLSLVLPIVAGLGLGGLISGMALFGVLRLVAAWWILLGRPHLPKVDGAALRQQLRYALPFGAAVALGVPQQAFHQFAVSATMDTAAFAVYAVGCFQVPLVDLLYTPTSEVLMVRIGELDRMGLGAQAGEAFREAAGRLVLAFVPLALFLWSVAPRLIVVLFTSRYAAAVPIFRVAVLAVLLSFLPLDGALRARGQTRYLFVANAAKALLTVPLVLILLRRFGLLGAIGGWVAVEYLGKALLLARAPAALGTSLGRLIPGRQILLGIGTGVASVWAARWVAQGAGGVWGLAMEGGAFVGVGTLLLGLSLRLRGGRISSLLGTRGA